MTLYLKYRPQTINELDSETARNALKHFLSQKSLPHAFLFSGPRGTGKTSSARILAKVINCENQGETLGEPCGHCNQCLSIAQGNHIDVIEMDAASNRGIDDVRALKQDIALAPALGKKKIYIIDEAHMLTTEASNALLKTLEEPPPHVVFVLATTDPQKLPDTVLSRLARVPFSRATEIEITRQLDRVMKGEGITAPKEVISEIAKLADGSFRDAVRTFEEVRMFGEDMSMETFEAYVKGKITSTTELAKVILTKDISQIDSLVSSLSTGGADARQVTDSLINTLHTTLMESIEKEVTKGTMELVSLLEYLIQSKAQISLSPDPLLPLSLAIMKWVGPRIREPSVTLEEPKKKLKKTETEEIKTLSDHVVLAVSPVLQAVPALSDGSVDESIWMKIMTSLRDKNATVEALLRTAKPLSYQDNQLKIGVYFQFHKERLEVQQNRHALENSLNEIFLTPTKCEFVLCEREAHEEEISSLTTPKDPDIISQAKDIFGT